MERPDSTVEQLFGEALDLSREDRVLFLSRVCAGRPEMRRQVELLLNEHDKLTGFMQNSPLLTEAAPRRPIAETGMRLGRYRLLEQLGAGGMGLVFRARDEKLERDVALKVLTPGYLANDSVRSRFRREALALARLNHPNIAALYDVGEQDGIDYIVMECVLGQSLQQVLRSGSLPAAKATRILVDIAGALVEAHAEGVVHRDLKPANVMITSKGRVKILDFGVAKLLKESEATQSAIETGGPIGTPLYMSPEQALGKEVDARTDLWSAGALYYETLTGRPPFEGQSVIAILQSIASGRYVTARRIQPTIPPAAEQIIDKALKKDPHERYQTAAEIAQDASALLAALNGSSSSVETRSSRQLRFVVAAMAVFLIAGACGGVWLYHGASQRRWAREDAILQIQSFMAARQAVAAFDTLERAEKILPGDEQIRKAAKEDTQLVNVTSDPEGAEVGLQDYLTPKGPSLQLGVTPLTNVRIPRGYFRWTLSKTGTGTIVAAPKTQNSMRFDLARNVRAPQGMVYSPGGPWATFIAFIGWIGPYTFPAYDVDKYEVTNREYQDFVDQGGYQKKQYWPVEFKSGGRTLTWAEGMKLFRDTTDRPGPSTWAGGHYPEGKADQPVAGVSWFEAEAYSSFAGKSLPVLGQWYQAADFEVSEYTVQQSNLRSSGPLARGADVALGPLGTYDMAGNVREWIANPVDGDLRFILGGSWKSPNYLYTSPEALPPFDRSDTNGFRCVKNLAPLPAESTGLVHPIKRDFENFKPASDAVFRAYTLLYAYNPAIPLSAEREGVVKETDDWREEKVTFDAGYRGQRMAAYLFLPKRVKPPFQTVLFFPSARVLFLPPDSSELGDVQYFDYIIQSGRAVMYPVYEDTYERRTAHRLPGQPNINEPEDWYKDAGRSLDYLSTRPDIDKDRFAYLGVSMGSADGVILSTLLQNRLRTAIFLDGGYFLVNPPPGVDQADFAPRMKKPVLMVNGRYDYTFPLETSQDPLFRMLGTPAADKRHVLLDTPHDVTEQRPILVREVLAWLDRYLGPVSTLTETSHK